MFKIEVFNALQTWFGLSIYTSFKQPFKTQPQIENEDVTWSPQYNVSPTRTDKRRAVSLQEVESGWLILHFVLETCVEGSVFHLYMCRNIVSMWDTSKCWWMWARHVAIFLRGKWLFCVAFESPLWCSHSPLLPLNTLDSWHNNLQVWFTLVSLIIQSHFKLHASLHWHEVEGNNLTFKNSIWPLTLYTICSSTSDSETSKWQGLWFAIAEQMRQFPIQSNPLSRLFHS